jgi:cytosine/uracil/thiamine/allantoin permease
VVALLWQGVLWYVGAVAVLLLIGLICEGWRGPH